MRRVLGISFVAVAAIVSLVSQAGCGTASGGPAGTGGTAGSGGSGADGGTGGSAGTGGAAGEEGTGPCPELLEGGEVIATIQDRFRPQPLVAEGDSVWMGTWDGKNLARVEHAGGDGSSTSLLELIEPEAPYPGTADAIALHWHDGRVLETLPWLVRSIDPSTGSIEEDRIPLAGHVAGFAARSGRSWATGTIETHHADTGLPERWVVMRQDAGGPWVEALRVDSGALRAFGKGIDVDPTTGEAFVLGIETRESAADGTFRILRLDPGSDEPAVEIEFPGRHAEEDAFIVARGGIVAAVVPPTAPGEPARLKFRVGDGGWSSSLVTDEATRATFPLGASLTEDGRLFVLTSDQPGSGGRARLVLRVANLREPPVEFERVLSALNGWMTHRRTVAVGQGHVYLALEPISPESCREVAIVRATEGVDYD